MFDNMLSQLIAKLRPAPLQVFLYRLTGANRRRIIPFKGMRFFADPTADFGARILTGEYEPDMLQTIDELLVPGATFLDIGANEGVFTVLACRKLGARSVVAVEPQSRLVPVIERNLELNGCSDCKVFHVAVTDAEGTVTMHLFPSTNTGSSSLFHTAKYPQKKEDVRGTTLQTLVAESGIDRFTLAKIDIEGAEYPVLMSSGDLLRSGVLQSILIEYHDRILARQDLRVEDIHEHLIACGYHRERQEPALYRFVAGSAQA